MNTDVGANVADSLQGLFTAAQGICWLLGIALAGMSCYSAIKISEGKSRSSWRGVGGTLGAAIALLNLPTLINTVSQTLLGTSITDDLTQSHDSALNYATSMAAASGVSGLTSGMAAAIYYTQFIGWLGAIRGWWMIRSAMNGTSQVTVGSGVVHIVAGVLAANVPVLAPYITDMLGFSNGG